jgi:hypothetical protein
MRTKVFAHKNYIGIESNDHADGLLNDHSKTGQLGFIIDAKFVDVQPEALALLLKGKKSIDSIGEIDIYKFNNKIIFSWLGGPLKGCHVNDISGSNRYNASLLKSNHKVKTPQQFIDFVNSMSS